MVTRKQEYAISGFGLAAVVMAFIAIFYQNNTVALVGAAFAIITMILSVTFIYREDRKLEGEIADIRKETKRRKSS